MKIDAEMRTALNLIAEETLIAAQKLMKIHRGVLTPRECYREALVKSYILLIERLNNDREKV